MWLIAKLLEELDKILARAQRNELFVLERLGGIEQAEIDGLTQYLNSPAAVDLGAFLAFPRTLVLSWAESLTHLEKPAATVR